MASIPSKSHLHRLLIYAAFADANTLIRCRETGAEDIRATVDCLTALGAKISKKENGFLVVPTERESILQNADKPLFFPCGESGSTLRFMLPVVCALGIRGAFEMKGRLPERPLAPLDEQLELHGIRLWRDTPDILQCEGQLQSGEFFLPGDISSQYITGMLMAFALMKKPGRLSVSAPIESAGYIEMTLNAAEAFSQRPDVTETTDGIIYNVREGALKSPGAADAEGDWSNGAFWLCAGAMPGGNIKLSGLLENSSQGDREVFEILNRMGANIEYESPAHSTGTALCAANSRATTIIASENERRATEIDARAIPDLIPVLAAVASVSVGTTIVKNAARLRIKESDRLMSVAKTLSTLGANIQETADGLVIEGVPKLRGGTIDAHGDHRIAMTAAIASAACTEPVTVVGAQAVNKSYPQYWNDLKLLGKVVVEG
jgi:3-phosphoshikimate 1-carboxyvinyltransferase